jgi:hypothetical protein
MPVHPLVSVVQARDRRNHFAREGLLRAVLRRFEAGDLEITPGDAADLFELPPAMCARLLGELVESGALTRDAGGACAHTGQAGVLPALAGRTQRDGRTGRRQRAPGSAVTARR